MSTRSWRFALLAVCLCCIAINAISLFSDAVVSSSGLGFQVSRTADSGVVRVDAVDSGGAAERSGLRVGDLLELRKLSPGDRYRILTGIHPHERIALVVSRGGRAIPIATRREACRYGDGTCSCGPSRPFGFSVLPP